MPNKEEQVLIAIDANTQYFIDAVKEIEALTTKLNKSLSKKGITTAKKIAREQLSESEKAAKKYNKIWKAAYKEDRAREKAKITSLFVFEGRWQRIEGGGEGRVQQLLLHVGCTDHRGEEGV